jgi:K+:H+ antiporter
VVGTEASRRGAELAFALTPARESRVTALHVAQRGGGSDPKRPARRVRPRRKAEKAMLDDIADLARRYGHDEIETLLHTDIPPDVAILEEAKRSQADLIVIGASRRVGDTLFLGETVVSVLRQWQGGIVVVAT